MKSDEQKLVDICFQLVHTVLDKNYHEGFVAMSIEDQATWVSQQLSGCGFETTPVGMSWGYLINKDKEE